MPTGKPSKRPLFHLWLGFFLLFPCGVVHGEASGNDTWQILETRHTLIRYRNREDLKEFSDNVDYSPGAGSLKRLFSGPDPDIPIDDLTKKVDDLYERVQGILDMRRMMKKVTINIYHDKKRLHAAYSEIYKMRCPLRAWYTPEHNTIYLKADDVHKGMLARQMAHSIIDNYLLVRPPKVTAEILAQYVDSHLGE